MQQTSIEWTDFSVNVVRARNKETGKVFNFCERVSPGCAKCYASRMAVRFGLFDYIKSNREKVEFFLDEGKLRSILRRKKPARIFLEDTSDLFGDWVSDEWLDKIFAVMAMTAHLTYQILTKRPERMATYLNNDCLEDRLTELWQDGDPDKETWNLLLPFSNVWLGVSVEDQQRADERIPHLLRCPTAVRWLSCEPLLRPVDLTSVRVPGRLPEWNVLTGERYFCGGLTCRSEGGHPKIDWVVIGGESGPGARPCHLDWIRSLVRRCQEAGTPCFVKQVGARALSHTEGELEFYLKTRDHKGGDQAEWPEDLRVRQFPEVFP